MGRQAANNSDESCRFYRSLRPVVLLATLIIQYSPVVWIVTWFWSDSPALAKPWFIEPESLYGSWLAASVLIWIPFAALLILARLRCTRPWILRDEASQDHFIRGATEATVIWTTITGLAAILWWYGMTVP